MMKQYLCQSSPKWLEQDDGCSATKGLQTGWVRRHGQDRGRTLVLGSKLYTNEKIETTTGVDAAKIY